jgi:hypothetical protein
LRTTFTVISPNSKSSILSSAIAIVVSMFVGVKV